MSAAGGSGTGQDRDTSGSGTRDPYRPPWTWDTHGGLAVAVPIPPNVVRKLGGPEMLERRLNDLVAANPQPDRASPETEDRLVAVYSELLATLESLTLDDAE